ncbi:hypothetical protein ES703_119077 [subsurface metagenome]
MGKVEREIEEILKKKGITRLTPKEEANARVAVHSAGLLSLLLYIKKRKEREG